MAKRKRGDAVDENGQVKPPLPIKKRAISETPESPESATIQIITGSYERILHGITAKVPGRRKEAEAEAGDNITFADTFLFNAHLSAVRCLALSPPSAHRPGEVAKRILASGSTDERINLYHLSANAPTGRGKALPVPTLAGNAVLEDPKNRELGSLLHHSSAITALHFPTRAKLLSAAEDNTIAVARTRDWTVLSTIKAPVPVAHGRPSGDTAPPGGTPAGVNDFAVHPSLKLMLSVGRGEKCMRLWNLVTGKKAGVLSFGRELLQDVGEGKWGSGEGRRVVWNASGDEYAVAFERGVVIFGLDSKPRSRILPSPLTKIHQLHYVPSPASIEDGNSPSDILAISTEDGRIIFSSTSPATASALSADKETSLPLCPPLGSLGGKEASLGSRIKDFEILPLGPSSLVLVTGSSDGAIRVWRIDMRVLFSAADGASPGKEEKQKQKQKHVGHLLGTYETGNRVTCLRAFVMLDAVAGDARDADEGIGSGGDEERSDGDD